MRKKTILIVDDELDNIRFIARSLKTANPDYIIINASNGELGVQVAKEALPDTIIMDWDMPMMNGIEATKTLSNYPETSDIPIIMASGKMTTPANLSEALAAGAIDYIRKPVDPIELVARTNTCLRIKAQNEAITSLLEEEISLKNRKLSTTSLLLTERSHLMEEVYNGLNSLYDVVPEKMRKEIKSLQKSLDNHLDIDKVWNTFKLHFEEVHPSFTKELLLLDSTISSKDLRLCAYLKMGMETKDIARLMNVSAASIHTGIYRLKKRLNLDEDQGLREFVINLA